MMHGVGRDDVVCSLCGNDREESDTSVNEVLKLFHYILASFTFETIAIL